MYSILFLHYSMMECGTPDNYKQYCTLQKVFSSIIKLKYYIVIVNPHSTGYGWIALAINGHVIS